MIYPRSSTLSVWTLAAAVCFLGLAGGVASAEDALRVGIYQPDKVFSESSIGQAFTAELRELQDELRQTREKLRDQWQQKREQLRDEMQQLRKEKPDGWRDKLDELQNQMSEAADEYQAKTSQQTDALRSKMDQARKKAEQRFEAALEEAFPRIAESNDVPIILEKDRIAHLAGSADRILLNTALIEAINQRVASASSSEAE